MEREKARQTANGEICNNSAARCIQQGAIIDPAHAAWSGRIKLFIRHPFGVSPRLTLLWEHTSTHRSDWYCNTATQWRAGRAVTADPWRWACLSNPLKRCRAQSKRFATNCCWVCITQLSGFIERAETQTTHTGILINASHFSSCKAHFYFAYESRATTLNLLHGKILQCSSDASCWWNDVEIIEIPTKLQKKLKL